MSSVTKRTRKSNSKTKAKTKAKPTQEVKEPGDYHVYLLDFTDEFFVHFGINLTQEEARLRASKVLCGKNQAIVIAHGPLEDDISIEAWTSIITNTYGGTTYYT